MEEPTMSPKHDDPEPWNPYKGEYYHKTRLLLLGESAYSWRDKRNDLQHPSLNLPTELVTDQINYFPSYARFMPCLTRALAGEKWPCREWRCYGWNLVAFTNYVNGTVGEGSGTSPDRNVGGGKKGIP